MLLLFIHGLFAFLADGSSLRRTQQRRLRAEAQFWKPCGVEGGPVAEQGIARFGLGLTWTEADVPRGASCSISTFGSDPSPGLRKMCECNGQARMSLGGQLALKDDLGFTWSRCASEGEKCACDSGIVRFGSVARWVVMQKNASARQGFQCSTDTFGGLDPVSGKTKECWCQLPPSRGKPVLANPSVAIVLLSRRPPDLKTWLQYHLGYMGVKHVFMDVEDSPHFDQAWETLSKAEQERVTVWKKHPSSTNGDARPVDDYTTLQDRQLVAMQRAKEASKAMGVEWLLHIDDDELLYAPLHMPIGQILNSVPVGYDQAYIPNVEAVYGSPDVQSCFTETTKVNMDRHAFVSYANGKAAVRVSNSDAVPAGPHQWKRSDGGEISSIYLEAEAFGSPVWLLHFESCPFVRWQEKFWELGNTSPERVKAIPFKFYKESITRMQHCRSRKEAGETFIQASSDECSQSELKGLWSHWKTFKNPALRAADLMPISIPWDMIRNSSA